MRPLSVLSALQAISYRDECLATLIAANERNAATLRRVRTTDRAHGRRGAAAFEQALVRDGLSVDVAAFRAFRVSRRSLAQLSPLKQTPSTTVEITSSLSRVAQLVIPLRDSAADTAVGEDTFRVTRFFALALQTAREEAAMCGRVV